MGDPQSPCLKTCWNIWSRLVIHDLDDMGLKPQWLRKPLTIDHWMSTCSPAAYFERWRGWRRLQSSFYGQNPKRNHLKDQHVWTKNTEHVMNVTYIHIYIYISLSLSRSLSLSLPPSPCRYRINDLLFYLGSILFQRVSLQRIFYSKNEDYWRETASW